METTIKIKWEDLPLVVKAAVIAGIDNHKHIPIIQNESEIGIVLMHILPNNKLDRLRLVK